MTSKSFQLTLTTSDKAKKKFTSPFVETIKNLYAAGLGSKKEKISAFKNFINEFGTHYAAITELGTKLTIERRYSSKVIFSHVATLDLALCVLNIHQNCYTPVLNQEFLNIFFVTSKH